MWDWACVGDDLCIRSLLKLPEVILFVFLGSGRLFPLKSDQDQQGECGGSVNKGYEALLMELAIRAFQITWAPLI